MRLATLRFIAAVGLSCVHVASVFGQVPTPEDARSAVRDFAALCGKRIERWSVAGTIEKSEAGSGREKYSSIPVRSLCDGPYVMGESVRTSGDHKFTSVVLANPKYSATVERMNDGAWSLNMLYLSSEPEYRSNVASTFPGLTEFSGSHYAQLFDQICSGTADHLRTGEEVSEFSVRLGPAAEMESEAPRPEFSEVHVEVAATAAGWELRGIRYEGRGSNGMTELRFGRQLTFTDWQETIAGRFPGTVNNRFQQLDLNDGSKILLETQSVGRFDFSRMADKIATEECFLSFYGLPEPEDQGRTKSWVWLALAVVLGAGCLWGLRTWRST